MCIKLFLPVTEVTDITEGDLFLCLSRSLSIILSRLLFLNNKTGITL